MAYPRGTILRAASERFFEKVAKAESGCWEWLGGVAGEGYGQFYTGSVAPGSHGKAYAHRWSYDYHVGPIPEGTVIDHLCRNRKCVNPDHLEPVPQQTNVRRGVGNGSQTHCPSGHPYSGSNLRIYRGARFCRACKSAADARRRPKKKG